MFQVDRGRLMAGKRLRIVVWNANMAVHRKLATLVERLRPDIAVVPECAIEPTVRAKGGLLLPDCTMTWVGRDPNKGLGVFAFGDYCIELDPAYDPSLEWIAPVNVEGPVPFALLATWASNQRAESKHLDDPLCPQPAMALEVYRSWGQGRAVVLAGDFNHNVIWDRPRAPERGHARTIEAARAAGLTSAYHAWTGEAFGAESQPIHYWRDRTVDGPTYHIDYAFVPKSWAARMKECSVGDFATWVGAGLSDHVPLTIEVDAQA